MSFAHNPRINQKKRVFSVKNVYVTVTDKFAESDVQAVSMGMKKCRYMLKRESANYQVLQVVMIGHLARSGESKVVRILNLKRFYINTRRFSRMFCLIGYHWKEHLIT